MNLAGESILVTGAGGTIGSAIVRELHARGASRIGALDHSEIALYELMQTAPFHAIVPILADVRDDERLMALGFEYRWHRVIHAAAYKHVPMLESPQNALEGLRNNVVGTWVVLQMAMANRAQFTLVSTDKAVKPSSFMGVTKRCAELLVAAAGIKPYWQPDVVRFGNVIGSSGSVVPLWEKQVAEGRPLTVTHEDMQRFMMSTTDAVGLVVDGLEVAGVVSGARLLVLDMGEPVSIMAMARKFLADYESDVGIEMIGLRPGEKLREELFYDFEQADRKEGGVWIGSLPVTAEQAWDVDRLVTALRHRASVEHVRLYVQRLVPDYRGEDPWWR